MKHTKKLIAVLICIAMLPWAMIPAFADGTEPTVLYSMTFDNSGDETERVAEWDTSAQRPKILSEGYLQLATNGWTPMRHTGGKIATADTFTVQLTYRHAVAPTGSGHSVAIGVGPDGNNYEVAAWRAFTDNPQDADDPNGSSVPYWNPDSPDKITRRGHIPSAYVQAFADSAWITVTLEITDGVPSSLKFESEELDAVEFPEYAGSYSGLTADKTWIRFTNSTVDVYDFRIVEGVNLGLTAPEISAPSSGGSGGEIIIPPAEVEQPENAGTVLYEMTFDNSGDENEKARQWTGAHDLSVQEGTSFLRVGKRSGWDKTSLTSGMIPVGTTTFTAQITLRHLSNCDASGGVSLGFSGYELGWRINQQAWGDLLEYTDGTIINGQFGTEWYGERIPAEIVDKWVAPEDPMAEFTGVPSTTGEWATVTLEVENGAPATLTVECGGETVSFDYQGRNGVTGIDASNAWFYFSNVGVEIYDYRVVSGTQLQTLGTPELPDESDLIVNGGEDDGETNDDGADNGKTDKDKATTDTDDVATTSEVDNAETNEEKGGCGASTAYAFVVVLTVLTVCAVALVKRRKVTD